jgi:DEAD/DEAH box helicase domain-containing protein
MVEQLRHADLVVGYNIVGFDYRVLMAYTPLDLTYVCRTLDLCAEIHRATGQFVSLESVAQASLGVGKTADGLDAIRWWKEGRVLEIAEYCCYDVKCAMLVHEHGQREGTVSYRDNLKQLKTIPVKWATASPGAV